MERARGGLRILLGRCALAAVAALLGGCPDAPVRPVVSAPTAAVLASFIVAEPLGHRWSDELVHFDADAVATADAHLTDAAGAPVLAQRDAVVKGRIWTVASLAPGAALTRELRAGAPPAAALPGAVVVSREPGAVILANDRFAVSLPDWSTAPRTELTALPGPLRAVRRPGGPWLGDARWVSDGASLAVKDAETTVIEPGPVRASVRQTVHFVDGTSYAALITLGARQDAALVTEDADAKATKAAIRLSMAADHVVWHNQWGAAEGAPSWELVDTVPAFDRERVLCKLRPWSFWWYPGLSMWAGFHARGSDTLVGVLAVRPSRWSPHGWGGFDHTEIPVTARPGGGIDLTFSLTPGGAPAAPLHREWAISATATRPDETAAAREATLRALLVKHAEFPLDEVKGYGFDAVAAAAPTPLLFTAADVARARRQARTSPVLAERVRAARAYLDRCGDFSVAFAAGDAREAYRLYVSHYLAETLPELYLGTDDPRIGDMLAMVVGGIAQRVVELFLEGRGRPSLGSYGPWFSDEVTRALLVYDLVAARLSPSHRAAVERVLVFGAHVLAHPDFWNIERGLASGNPNMTSSILLPRGLLGLALRGHPEAAGWLRGAEDELEVELKGWISPGGAWIENPYYQAASLDGLLLLAQAIKNVTGRDHFTDPRLESTFDYYGFLLTPPDRRFSPKAAPAPMVLPSFGNAFAGFTTPFNGWMAAATAHGDPAFSARQQFFWTRQASAYGNSGRARGLVSALTDPDLPAAPPAETSRGFPGFGSVLRTSWTDPEQSYVAHRTGPNAHHYRAGDYGSFVYYAKGAPLCLDWGNDYVPIERGEPWFHNGVSFEDGSAPQRLGMTGELLEVRSLPGFLDLSSGKTRSGAGQETHRHLLLVSSREPRGPSYLVIRDRTVDGRAGQPFQFNLFCLGREPEITGASARFPGKLGVDLEVTVLSPERPVIRKDAWAWKHSVPTWGDFEEEQHGIHVPKVGSREDFFTVLYPRAGGEPAPRVSAVGGGVGARIAHADGVDVVLHTPGKASSLRDGEVTLSGEIAMARRTRGGVLRLAVLAGDDASAEIGGYGLRSAGPAAVEIAGDVVSGESSGAAHVVRVTLPGGHGAVVVQLDGVVVSAARDGRVVTIALPAGAHRFSVRR
jgi:hypothetical protein